MKTEHKKGLELTLVYGKSVAGGYVGYLKEVPNVASQGESVEELKDNVKDAIYSLFEANRLLDEERKTMPFSNEVGEESFSLV